MPGVCIVVLLMRCVQPVQVMRMGLLIYIHTYFVVLGFGCIVGILFRSPQWVGCRVLVVVGVGVFGLMVVHMMGSCYCFV